MVQPSLWEGEVRVEYTVDEASALAARRVLPDDDRPRPPGPPARGRARLPRGQRALSRWPRWSALRRRDDRPSPDLQPVRLRHLGGGGREHARRAAGPGRAGGRGGRSGARDRTRSPRPRWPVPSSSGPRSRSDVLVVGGGTGGAIAAIVAAREGVRTTLIETGLSLGGIGTAGAIHSYYYGLNGGIQDEVDARVKELTPLFCGKWDVRGFHPEVKKQVLQQMVEEAGVEVHYDTVVTGVLLKSGEIHLQPPGAEPSVEVAVHEGERRDELLGVLAATPAGAVVYEATGLSRLHRRRRRGRHVGRALYASAAKRTTSATPFPSPRAGIDAESGDAAPPQL